MKSLIIFTFLMTLMTRAEDIYTPSVTPEFDLTLLGSGTATDLLIEGSNPLIKQEGTDGWIQLRGRNRTQGNAGLYLSSLEGGFDGELVAKVARDELTLDGSGGGLMARYALSDNADYASLVWQRNGAIIFRKRMGSTFIEEEVLKVSAGVNSIWMMLRVDGNIATFAVAKDQGTTSVPVNSNWVDVGERTAFSDFMYIGFVLNPAISSQSLESMKFSKISYQAVGGIEGDNLPIVAARGFWRRQLFHRLTFAVPASMLSKISAGVPDLKLTWNLNTSSLAGPFLFDNIRGEQ